MRKPVASSRKLTPAELMRLTRGVERLVLKANPNGRRADSTRKKTAPGVTA